MLGGMCVIAGVALVCPMLYAPSWSLPWGVARVEGGRRLVPRGGRSEKRGESHSVTTCPTSTVPTPRACSSTQRSQRTPRVLMDMDHPRGQGSSQRARDAPARAHSGTSSAGQPSHELGTAFHDRNISGPVWAAHQAGAAHPSTYKEAQVVAEGVARSHRHMGEAQVCARELPVKGPAG